jgi:hypothetical protein
MRPARRIGGGVRRLLPVALCALAAHLALYGSFVPQTGSHGYLVWYEPLVAGLSLAGAAAYAALLVAAVFGDETLRRRTASLLGAATTRRPRTGAATVRLALAAIACLLCQETIERSVGKGFPVPADLGLAQLLLVAGVAAGAATLLVLVTRSCSALAVRVTRAAVPRRRRADVPAPRPVELRTRRRRHPLADLRGLRAPPAVV